MADIFPSSFIQDKAKLQDVFASEATTLGINSLDADRLLKLLPASVRASQAVKFSLGDQTWRYIFGESFHVGTSPAFGIPHQAPLVANLVRATAVADRTLTTPQRRSWWWQIDIPGKHLDAILEMLAVSNVSTDYNLTYEQSGSGLGNQKIDWLLVKDEHNFLLEVKNRPGPIAQEMTRIQSGATSPLGEPKTKFDALFKSTFSKFHPLPHPLHTQGVVLFLSLKISARRLEEFFYDRLQSTLDFVALAKEDKETGIRVDLLAKVPEIAGSVLSAFGWHEGANLMYSTEDSA
jgi:hypothetical protein